MLFLCKSFLYVSVYIIVFKRVLLKAYTHKRLSSLLILSFNNKNKNYNTTTTNNNNNEDILKPPNKQCSVRELDSETLKMMYPKIDKIFLRTDTIYITSLV